MKFLTYLEAYELYEKDDEEKFNEPTCRDCIYCNDEWECRAPPNCPGLLAHGALFSVPSQVPRSEVHKAMRPRWDWVQVPGVWTTSGWVVRGSLSGFAEWS